MPRKKQAKSEVNLFYPNKLKINNFRIHIRNEYRGKTKDIDFFFFFHILTTPFFELNRKTDNYVALHSDILKCIFRDHYHSVIERLEKEEYIQVDNSYSTETGKTKAYKIHPNMMDELQPLKYVVEKVDKRFFQKMKTIGSMCRGSIAKTDTVRGHIISIAHKIRLVPNPAALAYIAKRYKEEGNPNSPETFFLHFNSNPVKNALVDSFGLRLHYMITSLPKVVRKCVRFVDDMEMPVVELDITNSQPFFLSAATSSLIQQFVPETNDAIPIYQKYEKKPKFIKFKSLCESGEIYETMADEYDKYYGKTISRDYTKQLIYYCFFSNYSSTKSNNNHKNTETKDKHQFFELFKKEYLPVYKLFRALKKLNWGFLVSKNKKYKKHANNALIAQRLESNIMYGSVVQRLIDHGIIDVQTVHDCVIVKESEAEAAKEIMKDAFKKFGLYPVINGKAKTKSSLDFL